MGTTTVIDASKKFYFETELHGSSKKIFSTGDSYLRINQASEFGAGIWMGTSSLMTSNGYIAAGSNGGTTTSRVYIKSGAYNGTNVIAIDGKIQGSYYNVGATTVIDSGRNISMASSLTIAGDGGANYTANHIRFMSHNTARGAGHFMMDDVGANTYYTGTGYSDAFNNWGVHYKAANEDEATADTANRQFNRKRIY